MNQRRVITAGPAPAGPYSPAIVSGGLVFVSGITGESGDITAQTRQALTQLSEVLTAAGSDMAGAVTVHVYLRHASDFAAMNAVYQTFWKAQPPSRTTVVAELLDDALIEVTAVAVPKGGRRTAIDPPGWSKSPLPYSYCVRAGDVLYLSGLVARDRNTNKPVEGTVTAQLELIMSNAREILGAAGLSLDHVVSARVYLTDVANFPEMNTAWQKQFAGPKPTRATVIAALMQPAYKIEVTLIAHGAPAEHFSSDPPSPNLSGIVKAGKMVFVSGALAPGPGDAATQTRETLAKLRTALARAGAKPDDVVEATVWLPNLAHFASMNSVYRDMFKNTPPPARATVGAALVAKEAHVEIAMTAILP